MSGSGEGGREYNRGQHALDVGGSRGRGEGGWTRGAETGDEKNTPLLGYMSDYGEFYKEGTEGGAWKLGSDTIRIIQHLEGMQWWPGVLPLRNGSGERKG